MMDDSTVAGAAEHGVEGHAHMGPRAMFFARFLKDMGAMAMSLTRRQMPLPQYTAMTAAAVSSAGQGSAVQHKMIAA